MENTKEAFADKVLDFASKHPEFAGAGLGGAYGAAATGMRHLAGELDTAISQSARKKGIDKGSKEYEDYRKKMIMINYGLTTALGAGAGAYMGNQFRKFRDFLNSDEFRRASSGGRSYYSSRATGMGYDSIDKARSFLNMSGQEKTKMEVKRKFQQMAMKHHPDRGGNAEMMKKVNEAWDTVKKSTWFDKLAFWQGFDKQAEGTMLPLLGMTVGSAIGSVLAAKKNKQWIEQELLQGKGKVDSKKFFSKIKEVLPKDTVIFTNSDLHKKVKSSKDYKTMQLYQALRGITEGNAAAIDKGMTSKGWVKKQLPAEFHHKHVILADDKVHPAVLAHEAGHIMDFEETANAGFFRRMMRKMRSTVSEEEAAWEAAPGQKHIDKDEFEKKREGALSTYRRGRTYPAVGSLLGGAAGMGAWYLLNKHAEAIKEVSKKDLTYVLKKHEERETPEQEAQESEREERIERAAGVEKEAAKKKVAKHAVMFHGEYAGPSKEHRATFKKLCRDHGVEPEIADVEDPEVRAIADQHKVKGVPHVIFLRDHEPVGSYTGNLQETHAAAHFKTHMKD